MSKKVLIIISSVIASKDSYSTELCKRFIKHYKQFNPDDTVIELDLNQEPMAQKTLTSSSFKDGSYFNIQDSDKYINQIRSVHKIVVSSQMMNFNVPGILKNYIDHVWVANKTFSYKYSKQGEAIGLLDPKHRDKVSDSKIEKHLEIKEPVKVQILATQGAPRGWYPWGDHVAYLKGTFEFIGCQVVEPILVDGTKTPENSKKTPQQRIDEFDMLLQESAKNF